MIRRSSFLLFTIHIISIALGKTALAQSITDSNFTAEAHKIDSHEYRTFEQAAAYRQLFEKYYPDELKASPQSDFPADELQRRFDATFATFFYTNDDKYIPILLRDLEKLEAKNGANAANYSRMYKSLIAARDFEAARDLARKKRLTDVELLPATTPTAKNTTGPSLWTISASDFVLRQSTYDMPNGPVVIMISAPNCHFSQNALRDIQRDPELLARISPILKLVSPPSMYLEFSDFQEWNQRNPALPFSLVHKINEWPMFVDWGTPNFYFFRDKMLKATVTGWPREGHIKELQQALDAIRAD